MEFFDNEKNWGHDEVKCGRSWKKDELRLKSNSDLHKLWYTSNEHIVLILVCTYLLFFKVRTSQRKKHASYNGT